MNMLTFDGELISGLNPYFVGKCSTAISMQRNGAIENRVLILILLENALRQERIHYSCTMERSLNPYFVGKCSTAVQMYINIIHAILSLNPYFFGKCSTAHL